MQLLYFNSQFQFTSLTAACVFSKNKLVLIDLWVTWVCKVAPVYQVTVFITHTHRLNSPCLLRSHARGLETVRRIPLINRLLMQFTKLKE